MAMIGDGMMAAVDPKGDTHAWQRGPRPWRKLMGGLARRPTLTRVLGLAEVAGGIWWALRQTHRD